ncbi:MAG: trypsin-like serine protease [Lachnospiraceae bacterium]|nr:trypsin-like serine protease [Lachnospiraceae bacterium]
MAKISREGGYIHISYDEEDIRKSQDICLRSNIAYEAVPVDLLFNEKRPELSMEVRDEKGPTEVADIGKFPYNTCGKLIMQFGSSASCGSASLLKRPDILLTAAHCVYKSEKQSFPSSTTFYWRLKDQTVYQIESVTNIFIPVEYEQTGELQYDYAICVLSNPVGDHRNVLDYTTQVSQQEVITIGYPSVSPYNGFKMYYTQNVVSTYEESGKKFLRVGNGLAYGGASGGPWVLGQKVAGVTSWGWEGHTDVLSPQFDKKFEDMYAQAVKKAPLRSIKGFKLDNDWGWFVCHLHIQYEDKEYQRSGDIRINGSGTTDLNNLKSVIPALSVVNIKVFVAGGTDKYGAEKFIFDPDASNGAYYKISGTTLCSDLKYKGLISL